MLSLDACPMLLPGHHDYLEGNTPQLTADSIEKIVSLNIHGLEDTANDASELFPAISMMNHARNANSAFVPFTGTSSAVPSVAVVAAARNVKMGEEVCIRYLEDEAEVARHWGKPV